MDYTPDRSRSLHNINLAPAATEKVWKAWTDPHLIESPCL